LDNHNEMLAFASYHALPLSHLNEVLIMYNITFLYIKRRHVKSTMPVVLLLRRVPYTNIYNFFCSWNYSAS